MRPHNEGGCGPVCKGCLDQAHAAGKREGIEATAKVADAYRREDNTILVSAAEYIATRIRALLQTEEKKP